MNNANSPTYYGFFSAKHAALSGTVIYQTPAGREVSVTCVSTDPEASAYNWDDTVKVGEVTKMVGEVKPFNGLKSWPW